MMNVQRLCVVVGLMLVVLLSQAAEPRADEGNPKWDLQVLASCRASNGKEPTPRTESISLKGFLSRRSDQGVCFMGCRRA